MEGYLIGIDAGTSLVKSVIFDLNGEELFVAKQKTEVLSPKSDWAEQDMNSIYEATLNTLKDVMKQSKINPNKILAVGLTAQGDGCWMIDKDGNPVRNAVLWSDGRAGSIIDRWGKDGTSDKAYDICGSALFPGSQCAILNWMKEHEPENVAKISTAFYCKDWLRYKLTGVIATDESDASLPFLNIESKTYSDEAFSLYELCDLRHIVPKVIPALESVSYLTEEAAEFIGLNMGTPVVTAPFDIVSTAIGVGAIHGGIACSIVGSTCFNEVTMDKSNTDPKNVGMTIAYGLPNKWLRALGAMMGTPNLDWYIEQIGIKDKENAAAEGKNLFIYLEEKIKNIPIGSRGLIYHPYLSPGGERAPFVKPTARAQFIGLNMDHTRYDMLRAVYEGVTMEMLDCYKHISAEISEIRISGGGASSDFWCQMFADATGKLMKIPKGSEFGAKGAVINAGVAIKIFRDLDDAIDKMVAIEKVFIPNMRNNNKYEQLYKCYKDIYLAEWEVWDSINELAKNMA